MYAVIEAGGKQERVSEGQRVRVERLPGRTGDEVSFRPVLLVDGGRVVAGPRLAGATVTARVVGEAKGPKITGFTYRQKARARRRWGHRQGYTTVEITAIAGPGAATPAGATDTTGTADTAEG